MHRCGILQLSFFPWIVLLQGFTSNQKFLQAFKETGQHSLIYHSLSQKKLGKTQEAASGFSGNYAKRTFSLFREPQPLSSATRRKLCSDKTSGYLCKCSCIQVRLLTQEKRQPQSCRGVTFLHSYHQKRRLAGFFQAWHIPGFSLLKAGVSPPIWNQHVTDSASVEVEWACKTSPHRSVKRTLCQFVYFTGILVLLLYSCIWKQIKD